MITTSIRTSPLSDAFGVEVEGVDLSRPIPPDLGAELRALFFRHRILVFRDQHFEPEHQIAFMSLINKVINDPELSVIETNEVPLSERFSFVSNTGKASYTGKNNELGYHSDFMFTPQGALQAVSLYAEEVVNAAPTAFADMVRAAALLPADLRKRVESLLVVNLLVLTPDFYADRRNHLSDRPPDAHDYEYPHSLHSVIERHPVTGEEFIDVSVAQTSHVVGWDDESSDRLFDELAEISYAPDNEYRHDWQLQDFVVWDNIALQHRRLPNFGESRRTLRRVIANPYELGTLFAAAEAPDDWKPQVRWDTTPLSTAESVESAG